MESIFDPVPINPVNVEPSIINENWPRFKIISHVNFNVNTPLVHVPYLVLMLSLPVY